MTGYGEVIGILCPLLEVCLVWRLMRGEMHGRYRFVLAYLLYCLLAMDMTLLAVRHLAASIYPVTYWELETISLFLRFLVVWEIYRQTFGGTDTRRGSSRTRARLGLCFGLAIMCAFTWTRAYHSFHSALLALVCTLGIAQAVLVLGELFAAKLRGIPMGRNIWGVAVGFGGYVSIDALNFALVDLSGPLLRFIRTIAPLSFYGMLLVWAWALWNYAPNPLQLPARETAPSEEAAWWAREWERSRNEVRKVVSP